MEKRETKYKKWKTCLFCGKRFFAKKDCKSRNQVYCSRQCYAKSLKGKKSTKKQLEALEKGRYKGKKIGGWKWSEKSKKKLSKIKKGKGLSIQHRKALSKVKKGKLQPQLQTSEVREKIKKALTGKSQPWNRGENHHNWRGGITKLHWQIRNSLRYKNWRRAIQKRDNYTCQICKKRGGKLHADHKKKFAQILFENKITSLQKALDCKELWDLSNGRILCRKCHLKTDTWGGGKFYNGQFTNKTAKKVNIHQHTK